jgi:Nif-specific regulatory protein
MFSVAIDRQAARRVRNEGRALETLYEIGKVAAGPTETGAMLVSALNILAGYMDLREGAVALAVSRDDRLDAASVNPYVIAATTCSRLPQPPGCGAAPERVVRAVLRSGVSAVIADVAAELGAEAIPETLRAAPGLSLIAAPIADGELSPLTLGVLCCWRETEPEAPLDLDRDLKLLRMVASLMAQALRFRRIVARDRARLEEAARAAPSREDAAALPRIIGDSQPMRALAARIRKVAPTNATVLLRGESGTGKEMFARAIHDLSARRDKAFVKVNCAALSETLLESELLGHEKGAFTGAMALKKGRFELADGGTLFLDEIGEISPAFQAKLLRALQEREFERVGGTRTLTVDVRVIAATNRDLEAAVSKGDFRADLYFRICVVPILLPPLRERPGDIPRLAEAFLRDFNRVNGANLRFSRDAVEALRSCYFPGNVRELENCVHRVAALANGPEIDAEELACRNDACLSSQLWRNRTPAPAVPVPARVVLPVLNPKPPVCAGPPAAARPPEQPRAAQPPDERAALVEAMERAGWVQAKAARLMGLTPRQIGYALKKHGVDVQRF